MTKCPRSVTAVVLMVLASSLVGVPSHATDANSCAVRGTVSQVGKVCSPVDACYKSVVYVIEGVGHVPIRCDAAPKTWDSAMGFIKACDYVEVGDCVHAQGIVSGGGCFATTQFAILHPNYCSGN